MMAHAIERPLPRSSVSAYEGAAPRSVPARGFEDRGAG
jgi:hypothetical protein